MTFVEYLDAVTDRLLTDRLIAEFQIVRERRTAGDGYLRARLTLVDGGRLEFSEYVRLLSDGEIEVVTYSYHWADQNGVLVKAVGQYAASPGAGGLSASRPRRAGGSRRTRTADELVCGAGGDLRAHAP